MLLANQMFEGLLYGYLGIIVYMILTGCGLPMPEEVAIIAGGALAASGNLDPWLTLGSLLIGALVGDCVMYFIGFHFGRRVLKANRFCAAFLTQEREERVEKLLARHGPKVLFVARFLVGLRGPIYITAGILKMPFRKFVLADLVCATVVVSLFFGLSFYYGQTIVRIIKEGEGVLTLVVITAAIIGGGVFLWYEFRRKKVPGMEVLADAQVAASSDDLPRMEIAVEDDSRSSETATDSHVSASTDGHSHQDSPRRQHEAQSASRKDTQS